MIFDEAFIRKLPTEKYVAGKLLCERFFQYTDGGNTEDEEYIEALAALNAFIKHHQIDMEIPFINSNYSERVNFEFVKCYNDWNKRVKNSYYSKSLDSFNTMFGNIFTYTFTEGDLKLIQQKINELRELIVDSSLFEENHKERLLKRLEKLQMEIHKKMSSLDKFWGLIGDAGVVLGKFGEDAKPFVDRIKEIAEIIWRTQSAAEELPTGTKPPMLS